MQVSSYVARSLDARRRLSACGLESDYGNWQYYQNTCHAMPAGYYAMSRAGIGEFVVSYMC